MLIGSNYLRSNCTSLKTASNLKFGDRRDDVDAAKVLLGAKNYGGANYGEPLFESIEEVKEHFRKYGKGSFRDILDR